MSFFCVVVDTSEKKVKGLDFFQSEERMRSFADRVRSDWEGDSDIVVLECPSREASFMQEIVGLLGTGGAAISDAGDGMLDVSPLNTLSPKSANAPVISDAIHRLISNAADASLVSAALLED